MALRIPLVALFSMSMSYNATVRSSEERSIGMSRYYSLRCNNYTSQYDMRNPLLPMRLHFRSDILALPTHSSIDAIHLPDTDDGKVTGVAQLPCWPRINLISSRDCSVPFRHRCWTWAGTRATGSPVHANCEFHHKNRLSSHFFLFRSRLTFSI